MNDTDLKKRTKQFALRTIRMVESLPRTVGAEVLGRPVLRSATSVAANYRSACRAKSRADFIRFGSDTPKLASAWLGSVGWKVRQKTSVEREFGLVNASQLAARIFTSKMGTVEEEADESGLWFELLGESEIIASERVADLLNESSELTAIAVSSIHTAREHSTAVKASSATPHSAFRNPHST